MISLAKTTAAFVVASACLLAVDMPSLWANDPSYGHAGGGHGGGAHSYTLQAAAVPNMSFAPGVFVPLATLIKEAVPGNDLFLTIDETIQYIAETELEKAIAASGADWGTVIIADPKTGEIMS